MKSIEFSNNCVQTIIANDVAYAADLLRKDLCVAIPTETVYGLAANALDAIAVANVFQIKKRPSFDPLIVHTHSLEQVKKYVKNIPSKAALLANHFWPGPLTLLLEKQDIIPDLVTSGLPRVAIRIPNHPLALQLLSLLDFPLAAPSANPFGYISPTKASHVYDQLNTTIPFILDGGESAVGLESTIIGFENDETIVYRLGGLAIEAIEAVVGIVKVMPHSTSSPHAPGMLQSHYAPKKPLYIGDIENYLTKYGANNIGAICFDQYLLELPLANQILLSATADLAVAATNLFGAMRTLDAMPLEAIVAPLFPSEGLGRAINDRLYRASVKS
jgi:L-threonylcarbamoyladenylate synthase